MSNTVTITIADCNFCDSVERDAFVDYVVENVVDVLEDDQWVKVDTCNSSQRDRVQGCSDDQAEVIKEWLYLSWESFYEVG